MQVSLQPAILVGERAELGLEAMGVEKVHRALGRALGRASRRAHAARLAHSARLAARTVRHALSRCGSSLLLLLLGTDLLLDRVHLPEMGEAAGDCRWRCTQPLHP